jgi:hypothetical protein
MITQAHLDDLWRQIDELSERLLDNPEDRTLAMMLSGTLDNYNAKLKQYNEHTHYPRTASGNDAQRR